jgi:uncharacterized DUF497 family protein
VRFEWDARKSRENEKKHGLSFSEAKNLFESGADYLEIYDEAHSADEDRFIAIGPIERGIIVVIWTEKRDGSIRIISARWATRREERLYRKHVR